MAQLPQPVPAATDWYLADYSEVTITSAPAAGGEGAASMAQVPQGEVWEIDRITVQSDSTTPTSAMCFDGFSPVPVEGTTSGGFDVADENSPVRLLEGAVFSITWSQASAGAVGSARIQYRILRRRSQTTA